ncbi:MAG: hypothetical protein JWO00_381 [Candidatus Parcubacteria bacterium]|nr:hypothetical protein [Candidatus Parcubacteria bacterium]
MKTIKYVLGIAAQAVLFPFVLVSTVLVAPIIWFLYLHFSRRWSIPAEKFREAHIEYSLWKNRRWYMWDKSEFDLWLHVSQTGRIAARRIPISPVLQNYED